MNSLRFFSFAAALLALASCSQQNEAPKSCSEAGGTWIPGDETLLTCADGAVSLALSAKEATVVADGQSLVTLTARVGQEFHLSAADVEFTVAGGLFPAGAATADGVKSAGSLTLTTGSDGFVATIVKVSAGARELVVKAQVKGHASAGDAGVGVAQTIAFVPLLPMAPKRLVLSTAGAPQLALGGSLELTVNGYADEERHLPASNAPIELCLGDQPGLSASGIQLALDGTGATKVTLLAAEFLDPSANVVIRACPAAVTCGESPACGSLSLSIEPAVRPIRRIVLSSDGQAMKVGDTKVITAFAYTDEAYKLAASKGAAVRFCATAPGVLDANVAQVDEAGAAKVVLRSMSATGSDPIKLIACPYEADCSVGTPSSTCSAPLEQPVLAADPVIASIVIGFAAPPFEEGKASSATVGAYRDLARTKPSPENTPVRFCVDPAVATVSSTTGFLDKDGRVSVSITPLAGSADAGMMQFAACPYDIACDGGGLPCGSEWVAISEAPDGGM